MLQESVVFYSLLLLHKSAFRADSGVKYNSFHVQILDMGDMVATLSFHFTPSQEPHELVREAFCAWTEV